MFQVMMSLQAIKMSPPNEKPEKEIASNAVIDAFNKIVSDPSYIKNSNMVSYTVKLWHFNSRFLDLHYLFGTFFWKS